jgi:hypothetical protein
MTADARAPHIWAHGARPDSFARNRALLEELRARHPRYRLLLTSRAPETRRWLGREFPGSTVSAPPRGGDWRIRRALGRLRPHALLLLEGPDDLERAIYERARWWRFPVIALVAPDLEATGSERLDRVDHFLVEQERTAIALRAAGVPEERISVTAHDGADSRLARLLALLRLDWSALGTPRPRGGGAAWLYRLLDSRAGRRALRARAHRLESLEAVRAALGPCDTILCIGNGPSSEDPRLSSMASDSVFRVNCSWRDRGRLTRPDVVFLGDAQCLRVLDGCIFAFRTVEEETRLLTDRLLHAALKPVRYLTVERLPVSINERRWPSRPTNGAVMVATAAALEPMRLVVAGIDLFQHPSGAYPADAATANDYLLMHDRETELAVLDEALRRFRGEVTVLSEPLARRLRLPGEGPARR